MPRKKQTRRSLKGRGFAVDILKKILLDSSGLIPKLLEHPVSELGNILGNKIKKFSGSGQEAAGWRLAGEGIMPRKKIYLPKNSA